MTMASCEAGLGRSAHSALAFDDAGVETGAIARLAGLSGSWI